MIEVNFQRKLRKKFERFTNQQLIDIYQASGGRIEASLEELDDVELTSRPRGEQTWTIYDILCHLADSESIGYIRILKTYLQDTTETISSRPRLPLYNQELWVCDAPYQLDLSFVGAKLDLYKAIRYNNTLLFRQFVDSDWDKKSSHLEYGLVSLRFLLELYTHHGELHLSQILRIRELLAKPLDMEEMAPLVH